jgi:23S rRNA pseudouridine1911/1915/1917 synthase
MNEFYNHKITINKEQNLIRLDQALAQLSNLTRSQIKVLITAQNVRNINGEIKEGSYKVKQGEVYLLNLNLDKEEKFEAEDIPLDIVYEDSDLIIINKKTGIVTHPAPGNKNGTLVNALLNYNQNKLSNINSSNRPGIVHRLDKDTSGLMVIAKNNKTHLDLAIQFKDHTISRKYKAVVWGSPDRQTIEGYIQRHKINRKKMTLYHDKKGKYSKTHIKLIQSYQIASLIECELETGRTHQVRVHMTSNKQSSNRR